MHNTSHDVTCVVEKPFLREEATMGANQFSENSLTGHNIPPACGVYSITDLLSGAVYIGSSTNIRTRMICHFHILSSQPHKSPYRFFASTYRAEGFRGFTVEVLELCSPAELLGRELHWIAKLNPSCNTQHATAAGTAFSEEERAMRSERTRKLWADPTYRARAVAARKGNTYCAGHKCTPEQVDNRRRAGRISNVKRKHGDTWREEYVKRYPEHAGDVDAQ